MHPITCGHCEPPSPTPGQLRTAAATRGKRLAAQRRLADKLERDGWTCTPPNGVARHAPKN